MMLYTNPLYDEMVKRSVRIRDDVQAVVNQNPGLNRWQISEQLAFTDASEEEVMDALCCADNKATRLLRELEGVGLIERKRRGLGKPSLIYVKNFISESSEPRIQNRENHEELRIIKTILT